MTEPTRLTFASESDDPFVAYALALAGDFCGVVFRDAGRESGPVALYYGADSARPCALRIPCVAGYGRRDVPRVPGPADRPGRDGSAPFPFDLIAALRFWLADEGNATLPAEAYDQHERLLAKRSAQEEAGLREVPIVNAYLLLLRDWLGARLDVPARRRVPGGRRCAVVLSHDVDLPLDPTDLGPSLRLAASRLRTRPLRAPLYAGMLAGHAARARLRTPGARRWLFDDVRGAEDRHGFRSTFFFASTSRFDRSGTRRDVTYDLASPRMADACRAIVESGWEVGLHIGYGAGHDPRRIAAERERLEAVTGRPVAGSRHHFWHLGRPFWPALQAHAEAGLSYDSSVAFNEAPGYRLGVALPFRPWDPERGKSIPAVQVPTMAMDGAFLYRPGQTVVDVMDGFGRLLDELKRNEGTAAIDWHQETSFPAVGPFRHWGEAYLAILDALAADPDVAVVGYEDAVAGALGPGAGSPAGREAP